MTTTAAALRPILVLALAAVVGLTACAGSAAPSAASSADPSPSTPPSSAPADPGDPSGGGSAGDPGSGIGVLPVDPTPIDPNGGEPKLVHAIPGRANPHPAAPIKLESSVDGRHVLVKITWYGGVDPCSVLDSVKVERSGLEITVTPIEGSSDPNAMCIEIAVLKATIVDLGDLEPGTWRVSAPGSEAPPIVLTID